MSQQLIDRSPDLKRLRDSGYDVWVKGSYLFVGSVPYLNAGKTILRGTLISVLDVAGGIAATSKDHVAHFIGEYPCDIDGREIDRIRHPNGHVSLGGDVGNNLSFSSKPANGYSDSYEKMTTYVKILSSPARAVQQDVTAQTYPPIRMEENESPFYYFDSASSRAGIGDVTAKLKMPKVGIVGLGGTGGYVLDLLAKTPIGELHLFDGDVFLNHNAFRAPGAPSIEQLEARPKKVAYLAEQYGRMRRRIVAHDHHITEETIGLLRDCNFVFLCLDGGPAKQVIVDQLVQWSLPFIDVGMGVQLIGGALRGTIATSTSTLENRTCASSRMCVADTDGDNVYSENIQLAELNALNASLAVIKWKKMLGFYHDSKNEFYSAYTIGGNILINEGVT